MLRSAARYMNCRRGSRHPAVSREKRARAPANCSKRNARRRSSRTTSGGLHTPLLARKTIHCSVQSTSASGVVCWKWGTSSSFGGHVCPAQAERNSWALSLRKRDRRTGLPPKTKIECGCGMNNDLECQKQSTLILTLNEIGDSQAHKQSVRRSANEIHEAIERVGQAPRSPPSDDQLCFRDT